MDWLARVGVLMGWMVGLGVLLALSPDDALVYAIGGVPLTVAVGYLVDRWWAGYVPAVASVVVVGGLFLLLGGCSEGDCITFGDGWGSVVLAMLVTFTVPATLLLLLGVALRRLGRGRGGHTAPAA